MKKLEWEIVEVKDEDEEDLPFNDPWEYKDDAPVSRCYVASDGDKRIIVIDWIGKELEEWMEQIGEIDLTEHEVPAAGLFIWEGGIRRENYDTPMGREYDIHLDGEFRKLTDEEWNMLQEEPYAAPWDNSNWLVEKK